MERNIPTIFVDQVLPEFWKMLDDSYGDSETLLREVERDGLKPIARVQDPFGTDNVYKLKDGRYVIDDYINLTVLVLTTEQMRRLLAFKDVTWAK
jgi:hypothetical protein